MSIKIAYPDIPKRTAKFSQTDTWGDSIRRQDFINNIAGPRHSLATMQTGKTGLSRTDYDLGESTGTVDHLIVGRANLLTADDVTSIKLRGARQSAFLPSSISGLKLWLDATRGVSTDSNKFTSTWADQSGNGYNAIAAVTATNGPILTRADNKENIVLYSEDLSNAAWSAIGITKNSNVINNPIDSTLTADSMIEDLANNSHIIFQSINNIISGASYRVSVYAKQVTTGKNLRVRLANTFTNADAQWIDGTLVTNLSGASNLQSTSLGSGWYRYSFDTTATSSGAMELQLRLVRFSDGANTYIGDGASGYYIYGVQISKTSAENTYIKTTSFSELAGISGNRTLRFDGTNDYLTANSLASIFTGTDKAISIFFAYQAEKASTVSLASFGRSSSANPYMVWRQDGNYTFITRDDAATTKNQSTGTPGTSTKIWAHVSSGIAGNDYIDYSLIGSAGYDIDLGARTLDQFAIGALYSTTISNYFQGYICEVIVYDSALSSTDRQAVEQYLIDKWQAAPIIATDSLLTDSLSNGDLVITSNTSSSYSNLWLEMESNASSKFTHSKVFFGNFLDMGECIEDLRVLKSSEVDELPRMDGGTIKLTRSKTPLYTVSIKWRGVTDAKAKAFFDNIVTRAKTDNSFYLYAGTNSDQLNGESLLYARLIDWSIPAKAKADYNEVYAVFEEIQ